MLLLHRDGTICPLNLFKKKLDSEQKPEVEKALYFVLVCYPK